MAESPGSSPDADGLLGARLRGIAEHHARWRPLTEDERAAAVIELRELAAGRTDLLAEKAGLLIGFYEGSLDEPHKRCAAELLIAAGANEALIPRWIEEGRRRRRPRLLSRSCTRRAGRAPAPCAPPGVSYGAGSVRA